MNIVHLLKDVQECGNGIINVAVDLACLQASAGHKVVVASAGGELENLLSSYGVEHFRLDQRLKPVAVPQMMSRYRQLISNFAPDIVHAHMMTGVTLARMLRFRSRYGLIATVHNEFRRDAILMGLADRVIAVSQAVADSMERRGVPLRKLRVVRNGTLGSPRVAAIATLEPAALQRPAITTVAGLYQRKGIADLIDSFTMIATKHSDAHLYIVGEGSDRAQFERHATESKARLRIHFVGFQRQPQRYLLATDIFVLASRKDPSPLVISEAREARCAIVATAVDGIPEALDDGTAGVLVPPSDVMALGAALDVLLSDKNKLAAARERAGANTGWLTAARVNEQTLDVYQDAIDGPSQAS